MNLRQGRRCFAAVFVLNLVAFGPTQAGSPPPPPAPAPEVEPAVSALNGKISPFYGRVADTYSRGLSGSVSIPVGISFGAQVDALYAHANEDDFYGLGGHFFARRPSEGLIGIVAGGIYSGAVESYLAAVEGEYYLDMVTLGAVVGFNHVRTDVIFPTFNPDMINRQEFAFAHIYASIYPMDDLMVRLDYHNVVERNLYGVLVEYQLPVPGLSVWGSFSLGDNNYRHALAGIRYYFGAKKSLKQRHRQDDPIDIVGDMVNGAIAAGGNPSGYPGEFVFPE